MYIVDFLPEVAAGQRQILNRTVVEADFGGARTFCLQVRRGYNVAAGGEHGFVQTRAAGGVVVAGFERQVVGYVVNQAD